MSITSRIKQGVVRGLLLILCLGSSVSLYAQNVVPSNFWGISENHQSVPYPPPTWPPTDSNNAVSHVFGLRTWDNGMKLCQLAPTNSTISFTSGAGALLNQEINTLATNSSLISHPITVLYTLGCTPTWAALAGSDSSCAAVGTDTVSCIPFNDMDANSSTCNATPNANGTQNSTVLANCGNGTNAQFQTLMYQIINQFKGQGMWYECWNEADGSGIFWSNSASFGGIGRAPSNIDQPPLVRLVRVCADLAQMVHQLDSTAKVMTPSVHGPQWSAWWPLLAGTTVNVPACTGSCSSAIGGATWAAYTTTGAQISWDVATGHLRGSSNNADVTEFLTMWNDMAAAEAIPSNGLPSFSCNDEWSLNSGQYVNLPTTAGWVADGLVLMATVPINCVYYYNWDNGTYILQGTTAGLAWDTVAGWLSGATVNPSTHSGTIYTVTGTLSNHKPFEIMFDNGGTCNSSNVCTTTNESAGSYTQYTDIAGVVHTVSGGVVPVGYQAILLTSGGGSPAAVAPTCTPPGGTFTTGQSVTCSTTSPGAVICYNFTGSPSTNGVSGCGANSTLYSGTVSIAVNEPFYLVAGGTGYSDSGVTTYNFTFQGSAPTLSPPGGIYIGCQTVTLSQAQSLPMCVTTNGSTPASNGLGNCSNGSLYSSPISVCSTETVEAVGIQSGWTDSPVGSAKYTFGFQGVQITGTAKLTGTATINIASSTPPPPPNANYFVSPKTGTPVAPCANGNDSNSGTSPSAPFATLSAAQTAVETVNGTKPLTIDICGGTYYNTSLAFTSADSGTATNQITWQNYPGHTPILSNGTRLTGTYSFSISTAKYCATVVSGTCYTTTLPASYATTNYFEDAFYSNTGVLTAMSRLFHTRTGATAANLAGVPGAYIGGSNPSFTVPSTDPDISDATSWTNLADIEVDDFEKWVHNRLKLSSVSTSAATTQSCPPSSTTTNTTFTTTCSGGGSGGPNACPPSGPGTWNPGNRYYIENIPQKLRYPGEFYVDRLCSGCTTAPVLYIVLPNSENPNTDVPGLVVGSGSGTVPHQLLSLTDTQYVNFIGLHFQVDNYQLPHGGYGSVQLDPQLNYAGTTGQNSPSALVGCYGGGNLTFNLDYFEHTTLSGLEELNGCNNNLVENSLFDDIGVSGWKDGNATTSGTTPDSNTFINNAIAGTGRYFAAGDNIALGVATNANVAFNDCGYSYHNCVEWCKPGINGAGFCGAISGSVHDNFIHNIMQGMTDDGGGIYIQASENATVGTPNVVTVTHNSISDVNDVRAQYLNNNNYCGDGYGGNGTYFDSYSGKVDSSNNLIYRITGIGFKLTQGPQVANQPDISNNNIYAYNMTAFGGVGSCNGSVQQFQMTDNIMLADQPPKTKPAWGTPSWNMQESDGWYLGTGAPTAVQLWANNFYFLTTDGGYCGTGTCKSNDFMTANSACVANNPLTFAGWQALPEDAGSSVTTNPDFNAITPCLPGTGNYPASTPNGCDDYSFNDGTVTTSGTAMTWVSGTHFSTSWTNVPAFVNAAYYVISSCSSTTSCTLASSAGVQSSPVPYGVGPDPTKFVAFPLGPATSSTPGNGFGRYPVTGLPPIPTVQDTFQIAVFPASDF